MLSLRCVTAGATKLFRSVTKMIIVATNQLSALLTCSNTIWNNADDDAANNKPCFHSCGHMMTNCPREKYLPMTVALCSDQKIQIQLFESYPSCQPNRF